MMQLGHCLRHINLRTDIIERPQGIPRRTVMDTVKEKSKYKQQCKTEEVNRELEKVGR